MLLRRGQHVALASWGYDDALVIASGCVLVEAREAAGVRHVAQLLLAGDQISRRAAPPLPAIGLTGAMASVVVQIPEEGRQDGAGASEPADGGADARHRGKVAAFSLLAARSALHAVALNELSAVQRLATLFLDLALRSGRRTPGGCTFDMPLSRADLALYLALNPDTVSRLLSRMKAQRLIAMPVRGQATVRNIEALALLSPLAAALCSLNRLRGEPRARRRLIPGTSPSHPVREGPVKLHVSFRAAR